MRAWLEQTADDLAVSVISCLEVAQLVKRGILDLPLPLPEWFDAALAESGIACLPVTPALLHASTCLPDLHRDPADRIIIATAQVSDYQAAGDPVISVDTKKKELIGDFKNAGKEWQPAGTPEQVRVHDFIDPELGKVAPYGVYDLTANTGWVNVGIDHDTAEFAVESIRRWWREMGEAVYPRSRRLLITADCGGSNGYRVRLWRRELQKLADELQLAIQVCHFPPGTSKWNKIEHRMFCHITANWRGRPLVSRQVVVNLIGGTTTREGLHIKAALDEKIYTPGIKVSDEELATLLIERDEFHGEWNYRLMPRNRHAQS